MYHNNNKYKITSSTLRNYCSPEVLKKYERPINTYDVCSDSPFERVYPPGIRPPIMCSIDSTRIVGDSLFNR